MRSRFAASYSKPGETEPLLQRAIGLLTQRVCEPAAMTDEELCALRTDHPIVVAFTKSSEARPTYQRDALSAVAYLPGWFLKLTYRRKWIEEALQAPAEKGLLEGRLLLFVLIGEDDCVIPLRFAKITRSKLVLRKQKGTTSDDDLLELQVSLRHRPSSEFYNELKAALKPIAPLERQARPYLVASSFLNSVDSSPDAWTDQVNDLRACPSLGGVAHSRMVCFSKWRTHFETSGAGLKPRDAEITAFRVTAGRPYLLALEFPPPVGREAHFSGPAVTIAGDHVEIAEPVVFQRGASTVACFLLSLERKFAPDVATMVVRSSGKGEPKEEGSDAEGSGPAVEKSSSKSPGPEYQALLQMSPPRRFWLLTTLAVFFGTIGTNTSKEALQSMSEVLRSAGSIVTAGAILKNSELIVLGARGVGALLFASAAWYAFRRLPVKF